MTHGPFALPRYTGALHTLLAQRRSTREFAAEPLRRVDLAAVAWAVCGTTPRGRSTPSAHARYPLTLTVVAGNVSGLPTGAHAYDATEHGLTLLAAGDHRRTLAATTLADADWLPHAAAILLLSADLPAANADFADQPPRGERGQRYVWLEAGHASQNAYLTAAELGLGAVLVGGFDDDRLVELTPALVPTGLNPLALIAIGRPSDPPVRGGTSPAGNAASGDEND